MATTERGMRGASARTGGVEERFAFARAASRLLEMQTEAYAKGKRRCTRGDGVQRGVP